MTARIFDLTRTPVVDICDEMYFGHETIENVDLKIIDRLHKGCLGIKTEDVFFDEQPLETSPVIPSGSIWLFRAYGSSAASAWGPAE